MSSTTRRHHADCSCQSCLYFRAGLPLPRVAPALRGLDIALDQIAEIVALAPDNWSGPREDTRRRGCHHFDAQAVWVCPDCGEEVADDEW
jgi:hypothetical protein